MSRSSEVTGDDKGLQAKSFHAKDSSLDDVLFHTSLAFRVPRFQRAYTWGPDHAEDFFDDLVAHGRPYFLGTLIFNHSNNTNSTGVKTLEIIDGQQRLLTVMAFNAALRDVAASIDKQTADLIHRYDIVAEFHDGTTRSRVTPAESLEKYFNSRVVERDILTKPTLEPQTEEEKALCSVYDFFRAKIQESVSTKNTDAAKLGEIKHLRDRIRTLTVIRTDIANEDEAYEIFERTNARGVDLSAADLLKNVVFAKIPSVGDKDEAKDYWNEMIAAVVNAGVSINTFVRYYWNSRHTFVQERKLFREIRKTTKDWETLLHSLHYDAELFSALRAGGAEDFENLNIKHHKEIYKSVLAIRAMGVSQCYVYLMSVLRNRALINQDLRRVFRSIEFFSFRYFTICKQPGNRVERLFAKRAVEIEKLCQEPRDKFFAQELNKCFDGLQNDLKKLDPPAEMFEKGFMQLKLKSTTESRRLIKYILERLNNELATTDEHSIDFDKVNLEHILPQNPEKESWKLSKREIKNYVHQLGNLVLLSKAINSKIQNSSVASKLPDYQKSKLPIVDDLIAFLIAGDETESPEKDPNYLWNEQRIMKRQRKLAQQAKLVWTL